MMFSSLGFSAAALAIALRDHLRGLRKIVKRSCGYYTATAKRHQENEDYATCLEIPLRIGDRVEKAVIAAVADGVSGGGWGRYASYTVITMVSGGLSAWLTELVEREERPVCETNAKEVNTIISDLVMRADRTLKSQLHHLAQRNIYAASTLSLIILLCNKMYLGHVGDTRIYLLTRKGRESSIHQLTTDHAQGNTLTNFIGSVPAPTPTGQPSVDTVEEPIDLRKHRDPLILLLSDGVYKCLGSSNAEIGEAIEEVLEETRDPKTIARRLVEKARKNVEQGLCSDDDATAVVVKP